MKEENNKLVPIAIVIVGILIAGAIYYKPTTTPNTGNPTDSQAAQLKQAKASLSKMDKISASEHLLGKADAPLIIVEYSDLECPYCKAFQKAIQTLSSKYVPANQLAVAFRQFPLNIHPKAATEAAATECVAQLSGNEKFWQYLDKIFEITPSNNGLDLALLPKLAGELGIDQTKFDTCLKDSKTKAIVDAGVKKGLDIGVDGTPFVVIVNEKGEKMLPFYEPTPETWSAENKQIVAELLSNYETEINKLRGE